MNNLQLVDGIENAVNRFGAKINARVYYWYENADGSIVLTGGNGAEASLFYTANGEVDWSTTDADGEDAGYGFAYPDSYGGMFTDIALTFAHGQETQP